MLFTLPSDEENLTVSESARTSQLLDDAVRVEALPFGYRHALLQGIITDYLGNLF
jgi:hypothetical protein